MDEILVVAGPTASGKTKFAVRAALESGAEIVSADSMQIYRHMDIGTAKPTHEEREGVVHHMIDVAGPNDRFSVADYVRMASECLDDIALRKKRAVIVGGTGLYISSLINNIRFPAFDTDEMLRKQLEDEAGALGPKAMHERLRRVDPESAGRLHENDAKRIIRALEVFLATGETIGAHERRSRGEPSKYKYRIIGLHAERGELYRRIDARVDAMMASGLEREAREIDEKYGRLGAPKQAIGYKEFYPYFDGRCTIGETVASIKMETRRYAKRQMTWFRAMPDIIWIDPLDKNHRML